VPTVPPPPTLVPTVPPTFLPTVAPTTNQPTLAPSVTNSPTAIPTSTTLPTTSSPTTVAPSQPDPTNTDPPSGLNKTMFVIIWLAVCGFLILLVISFILLKKWYDRKYSTVTHYEGVHQDELDEIGHKEDNDDEEEDDDTLQ